MRVFVSKEQEIKNLVRHTAQQVVEVGHDSPVSKEFQYHQN